MTNEKKIEIFRYLESFCKGQNNLLSVIDFDNINYRLTPGYFIDKTTIEFEHSKFVDGKFNYLDIIFKTKSDYFIYLSKTDEWDSYYHIKILFEPQKKDEVYFFIKSQKKIK
jgi:hypothetical protein